MKLGNSYVALSVAVFLLATAGCGGGGGGGSSSSPVTSAPSAWSGVKQVGIAGADTYDMGVATDSHGSVYAVGRTDGNLDGNSTSGSRDFILIKYDSVGVRQYIKQLHAPSAETDASAVAVDASDNVYVAGYTYGSLDGNTLTGAADLILTKYDNSGSKLYTIQFGAAGAGTVAHSVAIDSARGFVYVVGDTDGGLNGNTLTGTRDAFLAQYTTAGILNYVRQLGAATTLTTGQAVAVDSSGNVYVAGYTEGGLNGNTLTGTRDAFLAQYTSAGTLSYVKQIGAAAKVTYGRSVAVDASGKVYLAGFTFGGLDTNTLTGTNDAYLAQYTAATGTRNYVRQLGAAGAGTWADRVTTDISGNVYLAGEAGSGLNGNTQTGTNDAFYAKYTSAGALSYVRQLGAAGTTTWARGITVDAAGNTFMAGSTEGGLSGNTVLGSTDIFVAKYDGSGNLQ